MGNTQDFIIIEDENEIVEISETYLQGLNLFRNIVVAKDASVAINKLCVQKFFLILLDINIPKGSGMKVLELFKEDKTNSIDKVLIVSGELSKENLQSSMKHGVKNFLAKPINEEIFYDKVRQISKVA